MLELRNVYKRFSGIPAVAGASFSAQPGEVTGYLGPNGSGKSTTMKMIAGLMDPTSGEILFESKPIRQDLIAYKQRMGYVPEEPHLYTHLSGIEYLSMVAQLRTCPSYPPPSRSTDSSTSSISTATATSPSRPTRKECARRSCSPRHSSTIPISSYSTNPSPDSTSAPRSSCAASFRSSPAAARSSSSASRILETVELHLAPTSSSCIAAKSSPTIRSNISGPSCPCPRSKKSSPSSPSSKTQPQSRGRSPTSSMSEKTSTPHEARHFERLQFGVLYREFRLRVVDLELLSTDGDTTKLLGQIASLLLGFSFLVSLPILLLGAGRMPPEPTWTMEHFLIATTMVVVGLFAVLSWDSAFPDRRDVLVLGPLPVRTQTLFFAKLGAFAASLALPVLALNVFAGLLWPMLFSPAGSGFLGVIRALAAYWLTVLAAATFVSGFTLLIQGAATQLLPRQLFLRVSALLQVLTFCLFLTMYVLEPSLESVAARTAPANQHLLACLPTYWFLGLFQQLNGSMDSGFIPLASRAWIGLGITIFGAGATILLAYFRSLRKIVEQPDILPGSRHGTWSPSLGDNLQTAARYYRLAADAQPTTPHHPMFLSRRRVHHHARLPQPLAGQPENRPHLRHRTSKRTLPGRKHPDDVRRRRGCAYRLRVPHHPPRQLDLPHHRNPQRSALHQSATPHIPVTRRRSGLGNLRRSLLHYLAVAAGRPASALLRIARNYPLRTCHLPLPQSPLHLLLPARQRKCAIRILDILRAARALTPFCGYGMGDGLQRPATTAVLVLALSGAAIAARWRTTDSAKSAEAMQFNESDNKGIVSLNLGSDVAILRTSGVPHSSHPLARMGWQWSRSVLSEAVKPAASTRSPSAPAAAKHPYDFPQHSQASRLP